jgi:hypothetical protein
MIPEAGMPDPSALELSSADASVDHGRATESRSAQRKNTENTTTPGAPERSDDGRPPARSCHSVRSSLCPLCLGGPSVIAAL